MKRKTQILNFLHSANIDCSKKQTCAKCKKEITHELGVVFEGSDYMTVCRDCMDKIIADSKVEQKKADTPVDSSCLKNLNARLVSFVDKMHCTINCIAQLVLDLKTDVENLIKDGTSEHIQEEDIYAAILQFKLKKEQYEQENKHLKEELEKVKKKVIPDGWTKISTTMYRQEGGVSPAPLKYHNEVLGESPQETGNEEFKGKSKPVKSSKKKK